VPIPADICWAALAEYEGVVLAVEWVRGNPAPRWPENLQALGWMRQQLRENRDEMLGQALRVQWHADGQKQWLSFLPVGCGTWTADPEDTMH
jgi:hypothetical protein